MLVEILLNADPRNSMFYGYREGDPLVNVHSYEVECPGEQPALTSHEAVLENAFELFNVGDERGDPIALTYRAKQHRSLSVGDVVLLHLRDDLRVAYACKRTGWELTSGKLQVSDKYRCENAKCRQEFVADVERYDHYEKTGHKVIY